MTGKTTIAISLDSRKKLDDYKSRLEKERGHFVDMDEVISHLLEPHI
jgi:hypothetical protein